MIEHPVSGFHPGASRPYPRKLLETSQGGKEMIKDVPLIGIFVDDQEGALDFYTNELGLQKVQDEAYGHDARWITVSPAESNTRIVLKKAERDYEKAWSATPTVRRY
jgi:hypothetical protein